MITIEAELVVTSQRETVIIEECTEAFRGVNILFLELKGAYTSVCIYNNSFNYIFMFYALLVYILLLKKCLNETAIKGL